MYKKLVRYDEWHYAEVDPVRLKRQAIRLKEQIESKIHLDDDPYCFYSRTMPLVEAAIRGEISASVNGRESRYISGNFNHDESEGTLPLQYDKDFTRALAGFDVTVQGLSLEETEDIVINGEVYGRLELEEEGDWPDRVKHP
jgi:hypothetical protein